MPVRLSWVNQSMACRTIEDKNKDKSNDIQDE
jgi:hypothetical protein